MFRVKPGHLIRTRRTIAGVHGKWYYGVILRQDESGLIHIMDLEKRRKRELTSVDAEWMHSNGDLQTKEV